MRSSWLVLLVVGTLPLVAISGVEAQQSPTVVKPVQLTGLPGLKENGKGKLSVENGNLHFISGKSNADVSASSIQDVITGSDSQRAVGKTLGTLGMAAPYGGGRVVSLFRKKIDTLTVEYRDADGAFPCRGYYSVLASTVAELARQPVRSGEGIGPNLSVHFDWRAAA